MEVQGEGHDYNIGVQQSGCMAYIGMNGFTDLSCRLRKCGTYEMRIMVKR